MESKHLKTYTEIKLMQRNQEQHLRFTEDQIKSRFNLSIRSYKAMLKGEVVKRTSFMVFKLLGTRIMRRFIR